MQCVRWDEEEGAGLSPGDMKARVTCAGRLDEGPGGPELSAACSISQFYSYTEKLQIFNVVNLNTRSMLQTTEASSISLHIKSVNSGS